LFFLKSGIEVPYYLKFVTGELKTRAPAQAAKNEAKERERKQGEEDKAHEEGIEGMMALAGAHTPHLAPGPEPESAADSSGSVGSVPREQGSQNPQQPPDQTEDQSVERTLMQSLGHEIKTEPMQSSQQFGVMDPNMQTN